MYKLHLSGIPTLPVLINKIETFFHDKTIIDQVFHDIVLVIIKHRGTKTIFIDKKSGKIEAVIANNHIIKCQKCVSHQSFDCGCIVY